MAEGSENLLMITSPIRPEGSASDECGEFASASGKGISIFQDSSSGGRFGDKIRRLWDNFHFPVLIALFSAVITLVFGIMAFEVLTSEMASFPAIFSRWDASHYEAIASSGYSAAADRAFQICFFPLFPFLAALLVLLMGNATLATLLVANVACIAAFYCVYRVGGLEFDEEIAKLSVVCLALFPTAYFFHFGYTESLFVATAAASFLAARKGFWAWAGFFAFLASLTRMTGVVLVPALLVEYLQQAGFQFRRIRLPVLFALSPLLGIGAYLILNAWVFGDPLRFLTLQADVFFKHLDWPWTGFLADWEGLTRTADPTTRMMICAEDIVSFFVVTGLLVWGVFRLRPCYSVYLAGLWVLTFCYSFWMSLPRFLLGMFPAFFLVALVLRGRPLVRFAVGFSCVLLYALGLVQFVRGWWAH